MQLRQHPPVKQEVIKPMTIIKSGNKDMIPTVVQTGNRQHSTEQEMMVDMTVIPVHRRHAGSHEHQLSSHYWVVMSLLGDPIVTVMNVDHVRHQLETLPTQHGTVEGTILQIPNINDTS